MLFYYALAKFTKGAVKSSPGASSILRARRQHNDQNKKPRLSAQKTSAGYRNLVGFSVWSKRPLKLANLPQTSWMVMG